jgi:hypothetical protein
MGGSSSAGFCCAYASPSTRHGAPLRTDVDARDISSGPQARAQGQAQAVQAVQAEQKRKATANNASTRLAGVNAREREPGEGWRVLETAVVRVQAGGANCCTGESTRLATDWTASRTRTERMARERQSQVGSSDLSSGVVVDVSVLADAQKDSVKHNGRKLAFHF